MAKNFTATALTATSPAFKLDVAGIYIVMLAAADG